jgi:VWFA-related protein
MRTWIALVLCFAACGFAELQPAQDQPAQNQPAQNQPTRDLDVFRVNTQLVEVDVVVHSKTGPASGLKKEDFTILDNGKQQTISIFSVQSRDARATQKASALPPGVVSNRLTRAGEEPRTATVVLWDALNSEMQDQAWVQSQVVKYLGSMSPGDPVAVYILVKTLRVVQDFTDDPIRLIQALARKGAEQSADLSAPDLTDLVSQINNPILAAFSADGGASVAALQSLATNTAAEMTDYALRDRVYITQAALEAIAEHLSGLPGRKKLAWISGSFPGITLDQRSRVGGTQIEVQDFGPQINHAIRALNGANVAVYPIDPRGVTTGFSISGAPVVNPTIPAKTVSAGGLTAPGIETMNLLAGGTGGEAFYATNDAAGAIQKVMEDDRVIYHLGFYPVDQKLDGSYHNLSVKVGRKGADKVDVRARKGYFAVDAKTSDNGHWRELVNESMQNPLEATRIGLRASALPLEKEPGVYRLEVTLDLDNLHLEHQKDRWVAKIAFGTLLLPSESMKGSLETIRLSLTEDRLRASLKNGYTLRRRVVAGDVSGRLRVVLEDAATGAIGSVSVPIGKQ